MPEIDLTTLYSGMQKEMLQKLSTGANAVIHSGTKGDTTESNWINWFQEYM
jgi:L-asparaginase/Glu-tRNA(Gln) amidotransferase subunit D